MTQQQWQKAMKNAAAFIFTGLALFGLMAGVFLAGILWRIITLLFRLGFDIIKA